MKKNGGKDKYGQVLYYIDSSEHGVVDRLLHQKQSLRVTNFQSNLLQKKKIGKTIFFFVFVFGAFATAALLEGTSPPTDSTNNAPSAQSTS
jgi:hypothetical protein